jgi:hypothetical protein
MRSVTPEIEISKRDEQYVFDITRNLLRSLMANAGVKSFVITSTYRDPKDQARVMYKNAVDKEVKEPGTKGSMYGDRPGGVVNAIAQKSFAYLEQGSKNGFNPNTPFPSPSNVKADMERKIMEFEAERGVGCVSRHQLLSKDLNVLDIAISTISPASALNAFIDQLLKCHQVSRVGLPERLAKKRAKTTRIFIETASCIHVEIVVPIKNDGFIGSSISRTA